MMQTDIELLNGLREIGPALKAHAAAVEKLAGGLQGIPEHIGMIMLACLLIGGFVGWLIGKRK